MLLIAKFVFISFILRVNAKIYKKISKDDSICRKISHLSVHPLDCCCYPRFLDNPDEIRDKCHNNCISMPNDFNCIRNCIISESGVIRNGVANPMSITQLFYECSEDDEELEPITKPWRVTIADSVRKCEIEFPKRKGIGSDDYNFYYTNFVECVRKENFISCPNYNTEIADCAKVKNFMMNCKSSSYDYLHEIFFEEFYYRNKSERVGNYNGMLDDEL